MLHDLELYVCLLQKLYEEMQLAAQITKEVKDPKEESSQEESLKEDSSKDESSEQEECQVRGVVTCLSTCDDGYLTHVDWGVVTCLSHDYHIFITCDDGI